LEDAIAKKQIINLSQMIPIAKNIANGMLHLHEIDGIIHGDLSSKNIIVDMNSNEETSTKIFDFGLSEFVNETRVQNKCLQSRVCSPESIKSRTISKENDIWSYGILLWELMSSSYAFGKIPSEEIETIYAKKEEKNYLIKPAEYSPLYHIDVYKVMDLCLDWNPELRPPFKHIAPHLKEIQILLQHKLLSVTN